MEKLLFDILTKVIELNKKGHNVKFEVSNNDLWLWHYDNEYEIINHASIYELDSTEQYYKAYEFLEGVENYVHT
ncbi:MAG: hypothetical protein K0R92_429 [Lachnospiraceae bacterium]|nr:hypothetical protein [Lachnospiraceae bacterium]